MIYKKVFISVSHSHSILCIPKRKLRIFYCYCLSFVLYYRFHSGNNYVNFAHPCVCVCAQLLSHVRLFVTPWTVVHQAPLSMRFSSKNTGMGCHLLLPGAFQTRGVNLCLLHVFYWQADSLQLSHPGSLLTIVPTEITMICRKIWGLTKYSLF